MYFNVEAAYQKYLVENKKEGSAYKIIDGVVMGRLASACWYTNIDHNKRHEELVLYKRYYGNESEYPKYDNYDAINVDKVSDIPCDYFACAGVPITFLDKYNPDQFEIVNANTIKTNDAVCEKPHGLIKDKEASITIKKGLTRDNSGTESLTDSRQQTADSRQQTADSRQQTADSRQQTADSRQHSRQTADCIRTDCHQAEGVTESWACQSHSLTSTVLNNLKLSEQPKAKEKDSQMDCGITKAEFHSRLCAMKENTNVFSSNGGCNGIMGVPITFLDKYNPEQFEIVGNEYSLNIERGRGYINGKRMYSRIFIRRKGGQRYDY